MTTRSVSAELRTSACAGVSSSIRAAGCGGPRAPWAGRRSWLIVPTRADARVNEACQWPGLVELRVEVARDLAGQARHRLQLLAARRQERLRRAEVLQQRALARRADAGAGGRAPRSSSLCRGGCGGGRSRSGAPRRARAAAAAARACRAASTIGAGAARARTPPRSASRARRSRRRGGGSPPARAGRPTAGPCRRRSRRGSAARRSDAS